MKISTSPSPLVRTKKGQMSIFFALTTMLILTIMAFLVNVGVFVKAKINLQNAVDAAAFSGAAVQARQLTDIAYLNWELRNVYKEWMFKYYVLGQLSNSNTSLANLRSPTVDFTMRSQGPERDEFNIPSICIQFNTPGSTNICDSYSVPGVPRFDPVGLPGLDETHNEFINKIVREKARDCSERSSLNYKTATNWAYAVNTSNGEVADIFGDAPQIAIDRMGAWPQAVELAIRIRNLEKLVNEPPKTVCRFASGGCSGVGNFEQSGNGEFSPHERTVKAFWSAFRNLSNSGEAPGSADILADGSGDFNRLKSTFRLTELAPQERTVSGTSALFIPNGSATKQYLDLRLYLLNLVVFYHAFVASTGSYSDGGDNFASQAECGVSKVAIPVPAYPFGFDKNPAFLTYYAVKGEAQFTGLLNPFLEVTDGVKLEAYAAARPFGGRIGPLLFANNGNNITPRSDQQFRSFGYITGLIPPGAAFRPGLPTPLDPSFWVSSPTDTIGGTPEGGATVRFAIPNLIYDIPNVDSLQAQSGGDRIHLIAQSDTGGRAGLYDEKQFRAFKENLERAKRGSPLISRETIDNAIMAVRAPTRYEALNYLIPNVREPGNQLDSPAYIANPQNLDGTATNPISYLIPAPLYGPGTYYETIENIKQVISEYIQNNVGSIDAYVNALGRIASTIRAVSSSEEAGGGQGGLSREQLYLAAADALHKGNSPATTDCNSMAGSFRSFFVGEPNCTSIGIQPLSDNISASLSGRDTSPLFRQYFRADYVHPDTNLIPPSERHFLLTGYMPGPRLGAESNGVINHPFLNSEPSVLSRRNFYSTKLVPLRSLVTSSPPYTNFSIISEGNDGYKTGNPSDVNVTGIQNYLNLPELQNIYL